MGFTTRFNLRKPTDPQAPADVIYDVGNLADDVDGAMYTEQQRVNTALSGKAASAHSHAQSDVTGLSTSLAGKANTSHTHNQSDVTGLSGALGGKSDVGHGHAPSGVGIRFGSYQFSSIGPDSDATSPALGKNGDEYVFLQSAHPSNYLFASLVNVGAGSFQIRMRNSTTATTHTNITVWYMLVRGA